MGRKLLPMELIEDKKIRNKTFRARKESLKKKLHEITTLCGGEACMIVYGPYDDDGLPMELDIWPEKENVRRIVDRYNRYRALSNGRKDNSFDLFDFYEKRQQNMNDKIIKLRRANTKAKYPVWNRCLNYVSCDRLKEILDGLDSQINSAAMTNSAKENQWPRKLEGTTTTTTTTTEMIGCTQMQPPPSPQSYSTNSEHWNMQLNDGIDCLELIPPPLDIYITEEEEEDMSEQGFKTPPPVDINSRTSPTMTMAMSENYHHGSSSSTNNLQSPLEYDPPYYHHGSSSSTNNLQYTPVMSPIDYDPPYHYGSSSSTNNLEYPPLLLPPIDYDSRSGLLEDVVFNTYSNSNKSSVMGNYSPPRMQLSMQQQQSVHGPIISSSNNVSQVMMPSSSSWTSPKMATLMSEHYHYGSSSSTDNLQYTPLNPPIHYDPTLSVMGDYSPPSMQRSLVSSNAPQVMMSSDYSQMNDPQTNVVFNNHPSVMGDYSPPSVQRSIVSSNAPQVMMSSDYSQMNDPQTNVVFNKSPVMGNYSTPSVQQQFVQRSIVSSNAPQVMMSSDYSQMNYPQTNVGFNNYPKKSSGMGNYSPTRVQRSLVSSNAPQAMISSDYSQMKDPQKNVVFSNYPKKSSVMGNYSPPSVQQQFVQRSIVSSNAPNYSPPSVQQQFVQRSIVSSNASQVTMSTDYSQMNDPQTNVVFNNYSGMGNYSPPSMQQQFVQRSLVSSNAPQAMISSDYSQMNNPRTNVVFNNYPKKSSVMENYSPPSVQQQFVQRSIVSGNAPNYSPPSVQQPFVQRSIVSSNAPHAMMSSDFSQVNDPQMTNENSYEVSGFQNMNKRGRYY